MKANELKLFNMKRVECYWEERVFDMVKHWITVNHDVLFMVPDYTSDEEILVIAKRKDVIIKKITTL
jgi:hypothetical protein